jgi:hypothetical protein
VKEANKPTDPHPPRDLWTGTGHRKHNFPPVKDSGTEKLIENDGDGGGDGGW